MTRPRRSRAPRPASGAPARIPSALAAALLVLLSGALASCDDSGGGAPPAVASAGGGESADGAASTGAAAGTDRVLADYVAAMQKFADCLRSNGMTKLADPNRYGQITVTKETAPAPAVIQRAQQACAALALPMPAQVRELVDQDAARATTPAQKRVTAEYARCMQANGAPDFPDPAPDGLPGDAEWDQASAGAARASSACASIIGDPAAPGPGVG